MVFMKLKVSSLTHAGKNHHLYGYKEIFITGLYNSIKYDSKCYWIAIRGRKEGGGFTIKHFVTPNFVQAVFGPKH